MHELPPLPLGSTDSCLTIVVWSHWAMYRIDVDHFPRLSLLLYRHFLAFALKCIDHFPNNIEHIMHLKMKTLHSNMVKFIIMFMNYWILPRLSCNVSESRLYSISIACNSLIKALSNTYKNELLRCSCSSNCSKGLTPSIWMFDPILLLQTGNEH